MTRPLRTRLRPDRLSQTAGTRHQALIPSQGVARLPPPRHRWHRHRPQGLRWGRLRLHQPRRRRPHSRASFTAWCRPLDRRPAPWRLAVLQVQAVAALGASIRLGQWDHHAGRRWYGYFPRRPRLVGPRQGQLLGWMQGRRRRRMKKTVKMMVCAHCGVRGGLVFLSLGVRAFWSCLLILLQQRSIIC